VKTIGRTVNVSVADGTTPPNTVGAFTVPAGFVVTGVIAVSSVMASLVFTVGDAGSGNRYITAGGSGATNTTLAATGLLFKNVTETEILITVTTGSAAPGTVQLFLTGFIDN
jgi:hypothetical protein